MRVRCLSPLRRRRVRGSQGGVHIDLALRIWGLGAGDRLILDEALLRETSSWAARSAVEVTASPPDGSPTRAATTVVIIDED